MIENQFKIKGFIVWFVCALFFMYEFLLRTVIGTFQYSLMQDLHLNSVQFSLISTTVFLIIYGVMQIPVGIIVENFGLKRTLFVAALICGSAAFSFSYSQGFIWALTCRMLMGLGASFGFICLLMSVTDWMPHRYSALFIGLSQFIGTLGPMIAAGPLEGLSRSSNVTWQIIFFILGIIGIAIAILVLAFVENNQHCSGKYIVLEKPEKILASLKKLFFRTQPWIIAIASTGIYFSIEYLSENEGRIFLTLKGLSLQSASNILTISWIGYAIGCPLVGIISDYYERRKSVLYSTSLVTLFAICMIIFLETKILLQLGFFLLGLGASGISIGFAITAEQYKPQFIAVGFGLTNAVIMSVSAINAPVIGLVLDHLSSGSTSSLIHYTHTFYILIAIAAIGFLTALFFVKETFCKSAVDFTFLKNNS
ncbi:MAG: Hexuronate transporter [Chlamydiia bacterium]|nr:Hexuronate transporter [Chlamydiia bacterium]